MKSFTLIETLVAIAIFAIALGAVFGSILMLYRTHGYIWEQSQAIEEARRGIEIMTKEIRKARSGEDGSYPIVLAGDKEFIFFSDVDQSKEISANAVTFRFDQTHHGVGGNRRINGVSALLEDFRPRGSGQSLTCGNDAVRGDHHGASLVRVTLHGQVLGFGECGHPTSDDE